MAMRFDEGDIGIATAKTSVTNDPMAENQISLAPYRAYRLPMP